MKKRTIACALCFILAMLPLLSLSADACTNAYYGFTWTSDVRLSMLTLRLNCPEFRDLNYSTNPFFAWNNISSKIYVKSYICGPGETDLNDYPINIHKAALTGSTIGQTHLYKKNIFGVLVETTNLNAEIVQVRIELSPTLLTMEPQWAGKTITHELGHAFGLMHPLLNECKTTCIMQQSNSGFASTTVTQHDKNNLINKWGA